MSISYRKYALYSVVNKHGSTVRFMDVEGACLIKGGFDRVFLGGNFGSEKVQINEQLEVSSSEIEPWLSRVALR